MAAYWGNSGSLGAYNIFLGISIRLSTFFSILGFCSGNFFLIAPFPYHCLLLSFPGKMSLYLNTGGNYASIYLDNWQTLNEMYSDNIASHIYLK